MQVIDRLPLSGVFVCGVMHSDNFRICTICLSSTHDKGLYTRTEKYLFLILKINTLKDIEFNTDKLSAARKAYA